MPIDPSIALRTTTIDPSQGLNALAGAFQYRDQQKLRQEEMGMRREEFGLRKEEFAAKKELRDLQIASTKFAQLDDREQRRLRSTILGAAQLHTFLDAGDTAGAENFLRTRRAQIEQAKTIDPSFDTNETDQALGMLKSGDVAGLKAITTNSIKLGQALKILDKPEKVTAFVPVYDAKGRIVAQKNVATGEVKDDPRASKLIPPEEFQQALDLAAAKRASVKVDVNTAENSFAKEFGKENASQFFKRRDSAQNAMLSLQSTAEARKLLDEGVRTGALAEFRQGFGRLLQQAGYNADADVNANTDAYTAEAAKRVAQIIKAFGSGTGLSDADREYAQKAAAGQITITEQGLRKILDMNDRASRNVIKLFNKEADKIDPAMSPFPLRVEELNSGEMKVGRFVVKGK